MKAVRPVIASNGIPFFQMRSLGSHSMPGSEKEGKRKGPSREDHGSLIFL
jgi:hypothetical protein